jgi:hypothetical protein
VVHVKNPVDGPAAFAGGQALESLSLLVVTKLGLANNLCRCPEFAANSNRAELPLN